MISTAEICERLNKEQAEILARELLPNGHRSANNWMASGIADTGKSHSLYVVLSGEKCGHWRDMGSARSGEDRGDMLDLLRLCLGLANAGAAVAEAKRRLGIEDKWTPSAARADPAELARRAAEAQDRAAARDAAHAAERQAKGRQARKLWLSGIGIAGTPAEFYLGARELDGAGAWPGVLRYQAQTWCSELARKTTAMLAAIYRADGALIGCHRTYLALDSARGWRKLDSPNAKMVMGNMWGGFIPIHAGTSGKPMAAMPPDEPVYVTEGIEDAIGVRMMRPEARIIAAIALGNIGAILLPPSAKRLVIVCDRDENATALDQLERSIAQQQARGLEVALIMPPVEAGGRKIKDINDWICALNAEARADKPEPSQ